jgi:hypothetical protein
MPRVVTVGKWEDPNDKFPKFEAGTSYLMRVTKIDETKMKNKFTGQDDDKLYIHMECCDPVHPQHIGRTNRLLTNKVPTTNMQNQLTQLMMYTVLRGRIPSKNESFDIDSLINQQVVCTFQHTSKDGRDYERVIQFAMAGGYASNAPVQAPPAAAQPQKLPVPQGWDSHFDVASGKWLFLAPGARQWQWEPPPGMQPVAPSAPPAPPVPQAPVQPPAPQQYQQPAPPAPQQYQQPASPPTAPMPFPQMPR